MIMKAYLTVMVLICLVVVACSQQSVNDVHLRLEVQPSVNPILLFPILEIENRSPEEVFVYVPQSMAMVRHDTVSSTIELDFTISEMPEGMTYYEFPPPLFTEIEENSSVRLHVQRSFKTTPGDLPQEEVTKSAIWAYATVGYLKGRHKLYEFRSGHELRDFITKHQQKTTSARIRIGDKLKWSSGSL